MSANNRLPSRRKLLAAAVALTSSLLPALSLAAQPQIDPGKLPSIGRTDERFLSYNIDFANVTGTTPQPPDLDKAASGPPGATTAMTSPLLSGPHRYRPPVDLSNHRLRALAAALGPAYVRASGTSTNTVFFQDDDAPALTKPPAGYRTVLTRAEWKGFVEFVRAVDGKILTSFAINDAVRDASGTWTPVQARRLVDFTHAIGGSIYAAELFNEPNLPMFGGGPKGYDPAWFARDEAAFRAFAQAAIPDMKIVGPGDVIAANLPIPGTPTPEQLMSGRPQPRFDIISYHFYPAVSSRCAPPNVPVGASPDQALTEQWLSRTDTSFQTHKALRDRYAPGAPIWNTETGGAACAGAAWDATFLDSFRFVDQLGRLARQGASVVFHQTLVGGDYGLLEPETFEPRANYWVALAWKRLMGDRVLDAGPSRPGLHLYAACQRGTSGGVTLLAINTENAPANLKLAVPAQIYALTAPQLQSRTVLLNGKPLILGAGDAVPTLRGQPRQAGVLALAPTSITFIAASRAKNPSCM
jgi:hypothetical protein